uniref:Uncharacterized protein n=1 Tax=Arundo donax TaxID=35708 RepID=A0A0A9TDN5_ARUDO
MRRRWLRFRAAGGEGAADVAPEEQRKLLLVLVGRRRRGSHARGWEKERR